MFGKAELKSVGDDDGNMQVDSRLGEARRRKGGSRVTEWKIQRERDTNPKRRSAAKQKRTKRAVDLGSRGSIKKKKKAEDVRTSHKKTNSS